MYDERTLDRIEHILAAIAGIERLTGNKTLDEYANDVDVAAAVERHFERLSEASRHLPESFTEKHPEVPWRAVADLGNVLRHAYDQVVDERIWRIVEKDLPSLKNAIVAMHRELTAGEPE
jgi:uncharacterized protein with HEPN domain